MNIERRLAVGMVLVLAGTFTSVRELKAASVIAVKVTCNDGSATASGDVITVYAQDALMHQYPSGPPSAGVYTINYTLSADTLAGPDHTLSVNVHVIPGSGGSAYTTSVSGILGNDPNTQIIHMSVGPPGSRPLVVECIEAPVQCRGGLFRCRCRCR